LEIVYTVPEIFLKFFSGVIIGTPEVIVWYEVINFTVVFILVYNYYWITFISLRNYSSVTD